MNYWTLTHVSVNDDSQNTVNYDMCILYVHERLNDQLLVKCDFLGSTLTIDLQCQSGK